MSRRSVSWHVTGLLPGDRGGSAGRETPHEGTGSEGFASGRHLCYLSSRTPQGCHADVAQLVEPHLAKVRVAGSSPVIRSGDWRSGSALP